MVSFGPGMMVMADNIADLFDQIFPGAQFGQDLPGNGRSFFFLISGGRALVFSFRLMDADVVQIGRRQDNGQIALFLLWPICSA